MRARRRNSRCTGLAGGTLLPWRPDYFCGCRRTLPSQHNSGRINDPSNRLGGQEGGRGSSVLPPRLCFSSKVVRKTRCSPAPAGLGVGKSFSSLSRISTAASPHPGDAAWRGGGGLCKAKKKKEQKAMGKGGGKRRQEPAPSGRERRACQLALGSSQPSGGAVGAGFPPWEERMEPHPAPGRRGSSGCAGDAPGDAPGAAAPCSGGGWDPGLRGGMRALLGEMDAPPGGDAGTLRSTDAPPGPCKCSWARRMHAGGDAGVPGGRMWVLLRIDAPRGGECTSFSTAGSSYLSAAPRCPPKAGNAQSSPASSPACRGALQQGSGGLWKRSPCGAGGCGVGTGGAWVSPTTNFSLLGRPGPLLRRESPPCGVDRHRLLSMHITRRGIAPLRLPPALPPRALSFSQGCCSACWHSCIPGASPGLGALAPPAATPAGSPAGVRRDRKSVV